MTCPFHLSRLRVVACGESNVVFLFQAEGGIRYSSVTGVQTCALPIYFDPEADWDADEFSYAYDRRSTEDRSLFLNPFEALSLVEVKVFPNRLDPVLIASTDVHLSWIGDKGQTREPVLSVVPGGQAQTWRVRRRDPTRRDYTWRLVHHLKDSTPREPDPSTRA